VIETCSSPTSMCFMICDHGKNFAVSFSHRSPIGEQCGRRKVSRDYMSKVAALQEILQICELPALRDCFRGNVRVLRRIYQIIGELPQPSSAGDHEIVSGRVKLRHRQRHEFEQIAHFRFSFFDSKCLQKSLCGAFMPGPERSVNYERFQSLRGFRFNFFNRIFRKRQSRRVSKQNPF
jgi:hypothetical protein